MGEFATSFEMAGVSLMITQLAAQLALFPRPEPQERVAPGYDELEQAWISPATAPGYRHCCAPLPPLRPATAAAPIARRLPAAARNRPHRSVTDPPACSRCRPARPRSRYCYVVNARILRHSFLELNGMFFERLYVAAVARARRRCRSGLLQGAYVTLRWCQIA